MEYITAFRKPEQTQYGMSCIDNVCKPLVINQFWLYDSLPDTSRMKEALAELLDGYPTLAGRISDNGIVCNNTGILWEETDCRKFRIKDISRKTMPEKRFHAVFDNKAALAGKFPLMSVKISRLEDGAVLNVKCSHFCADGNAFYTMMENWASLTRNEGLVRRPVYDDTAVRKALDGSDVYRRLASSDISTACGMLEKEGMFRIRRIKVQRCDALHRAKSLDKKEFQKLVKTARGSGKEQTAMIMETICATGIRVSELKYFRVEDLKNGMVRVWNKGKYRMVLIPEKLRKKLLVYAGKQKIRTGIIFRTRSGREKNRSNIWKEMKKVAEDAGVKLEKVFPHNLRHLFARTFYKLTKDLINLADILGHSSIEVTRIYTTDGIQEWRRNLNRMKLLDD